MGDGKWQKFKLEQRMDEIAEKGYAAHWKYKSWSQRKFIVEWIEKTELLTNPESNAIDFVDDFKPNLYSGEIYVFTIHR